MDKQEFTVFGDGDGSAPELESIGTGPIENAYNMEPRGYPYIAVLGPEGARLVAAGHEQVAEYWRGREGK